MMPSSLTRLEDWPLTESELRSLRRNTTPYSANMLLGDVAALSFGIGAPLLT